MTVAAGVLSVIWLLPIGARGSLVFQPPTASADARSTAIAADGTGLIDVETGVAALAADTRLSAATGELAAMGAFQDASTVGKIRVPNSSDSSDHGSAWWPVEGTISWPGDPRGSAAARRNWTGWFTSHSFRAGRDWESGRFAAVDLLVLGGETRNPSSAPMFGSLSFALSVGSDPGVGAAHRDIFGVREAGPDGLLAGVRAGPGSSGRVGGNGRADAGSADATLAGAGSPEPPAWLRWALDLMAEFGVLGSAIGMAMAAFLIKFIATMTTR
ncbi:MAG: hypothetical protein J5I93_05295 [Pirellulaceae bacterium]|nr:hypothetical protein [Pirellulaceae bacterium]